MSQQYSHLSFGEKVLIEKLHRKQHLSARKTTERISWDKPTVPNVCARIEINP